MLSGCPFFFLPLSGRMAKMDTLRHAPPSRLAGEVFERREAERGRRNEGGGGPRIIGLDRAGHGYKGRSIRIKLLLSQNHSQCIIQTSSMITCLRRVNFPFPSGLVLGERLLVVVRGVWGAPSSRSERSFLVREAQRRPRGSGQRAPATADPAAWPCGVVGDV